MENNDDFILDMLNEAEKNSTPIDNKSTSNLCFKRDEKGILWSYNKATGKKVGRIFEHGNVTAKSFNEIKRD